MYVQGLLSRPLPPGGLFGKMCGKCFGFLCAAMKTREQRKIIDRKAVM